jgi:hypothetical protein
LNTYITIPGKSSDTARCFSAKIRATTYMPAVADILVTTSPPAERVVHAIVSTRKPLK